MLLKELKKQIEKLDKNKHIEIMKIIYDNDIDFTNNSNGIFINLTNINLELLNKLENYLKFINEQEKELDAFIVEKNHVKEEYFTEEKKD